MSCIPKKRRSKEFRTAISKVKEYYKKFHLINAKLKEITKHEVVLPNERKRWVMNDFKLIQQQIICIMETVNNLEDKYKLTKLTFDVSSVFPKSEKGSCLLEKCYQIDQSLNNYELAWMKINLKINKQVSENEIGKLCASMNNGPIPSKSAPIIKKEGNPQFFDDQKEAVSYMDWRLCNFFQNLNDIEVGIYLVPPISVKKQFFEMSKIDLEQMINSGSPLTYFQSNLAYLYNYIDEMKLNVKRLGTKLGVKISQKSYCHMELSDINHFSKNILEIFEEISVMQFDLQRLSMYDGNEQATEEDRISEHYESKQEIKISEYEENEQDIKEDDISEYDESDEEIGEGNTSEYDDIEQESPEDEFSDFNESDLELEEGKFSDYNESDLEIEEYEISDYDEIDQEIEEIFEQMSFKRLSDYNVNEKEIKAKGPNEQPNLPRALIPKREEKMGNQTPDSKSDLKNCLEYVKNQCGKHDKNEMAELLNISRRTFFRKIKDQNIEPINKGNKNCEFCKRKREKGIDVTPSTSVITDEIKDHLKNACIGHKVTVMARILEIKPITLRSYMLRNKIKFTNKDPIKCYFCVCGSPVDPKNPLAIWRSMQPIIDLIKKLAFQEKKTDGATICRIASSMLYHSNRKASQVFQEFGEDTEKYLSKFKYNLPIKQAIQLKTNLKLIVK